MRHLTVFVIAFLVNLLTHGVAAAQPSVYLQFDGIDGQVEVPNYAAFSINGALTVEALMRPDAWVLPATCLDPNMPPYVQSSPYFEKTEDATGGTAATRYVHWLGKGCPWVDALGKCCTVDPTMGTCVEHGATMQQEWTFRIYSCDQLQINSMGQEEHRAGRISFYVFNPVGGEGSAATISRASGSSRVILYGSRTSGSMSSGSPTGIGRISTWTGSSRTATGTRRVTERICRILEIRHVLVPGTSFRANNWSSHRRRAQRRSVWHTGIESAS